MADYYGTLHRVAEVDPYRPARTELIGNNTGQAGTNDVGKPVKLSGDTVVLCADGDEIYGFIESVEPGTVGGYSHGGVLCESGNQIYATDEAGTLSVGDIVVAGTAVAFGTANPATGPNVKARTNITSTGHSVVYNSGALAIKAGSSALAKTTATVVANVGGSVVSKAAGDMAALSGTVTNAAFNVFAFFIDAAGTLTTVMGTEGASLADVVIPSATSARAMIGFVIINPTGTGDFVGGTTALDDGTVVPNAVYVNTPGAVTQADQIVGDHLWQVVAKYTTPSGGVLIRKI